LLAVFLFSAVAWTDRVSAQQRGDQWIPFADDSEFFQVSMPHYPQVETISTLATNYGRVDVRGKSYLASADGAVYTVWALTSSGDAAKHRRDLDAYLDACAELIWEGLLKQARDAVPVERQKMAHMAYRKELPAKPLPGREYGFTIGENTGTTQFYVAESRVYVLLVAGPPGGAWNGEPLFQSFKVSPGLSLLPPNDAETAGVIKDSGETITGEQIFKSSEVTQRFKILDKPEPSYTESARKFGVTGTVVLRAVFSKDGQVTNIHVIRKLPHGLTKKALDAARIIRFSPATKDGQPVSMWIQLEYNFNLY
jgi:TonB family protein